MSILTIKKTKSFAGCLKKVKGCMRGTRKGLLMLIAVVLVGAVLTSCSSFTTKAKTFSSNGMTITLTNAFKEISVENYTVAYDSKNVAVFALKEAFTLAEGFENNTLEQYAELVLNANNLSSAEVKTADGLTGFEYDFTNPETNDTYKYFSYVYKTEDAFWMVQFATLNENAEKYASEIKEWAKSVKFDK